MYDILKNLRFWLNQKNTDYRIINANTELITFDVLSATMGSLPRSSEVLEILEDAEVQYDVMVLDCNVLLDNDIEYTSAYETMYFIDVSAFMKVLKTFSRSSPIRHYVNATFVTSICHSLHESDKCFGASMLSLQINGTSMARIYLYTGTVEQVCKKMRQRLSGKYTITKLLPVARKHSVFISPIKYTSHYEIPYMVLDIIKDAGFGKVDQTTITWDTSRPITLEMLKDIFIQELNILSTKQTTLRLEHRQ